MGEMGDQAAGYPPALSSTLSFTLSEQWSEFDKVEDKVSDKVWFLGQACSYDHRTGS